MATLGEQFAEAFADKDREGVAALLDPQVDFRALTPNRNWDASSPEEVVEILFGSWIEDDDHIDEVIAVESGGVSDRERVSYRFGGHNGDGPFVVEQQAYLAAEGDRIAWMRVLCSGFRPA